MVQSNRVMFWGAVLRARGISECALRAVRSHFDQ